MTKTQKAKMIKELNDVISLRNHIYTLVNGPRTSLITREEEGKLRQFANNLDREVVNKSLEMAQPPEVSDPVLPETKTAVVKAQAVKAKEEKVKENKGKVSLETATKPEDKKPVGVFRRVDE